MAKCIACGGKTKRSSLIREAIGGRIQMFCCTGCEELFRLKNEMEVVPLGKNYIY